MCEEQKLVAYTMNRAGHRVEKLLGEENYMQLPRVRGLLQKVCGFFGQCRGHENELLHRLQVKSFHALKRYSYQGFPLIYSVKIDSLGEFYGLGKKRGSEKSIWSLSVFLQGRAVRSEIAIQEESLPKNYLLQELIEKVKCSLPDGGGIRVLRCKEKVRSQIEWLHERKLLYILKSSCVSLVFLKHSEQWKKTTDIPLGKHAIRLYTGVDLRVHVVPKKRGGGTIRYFTNIDLSLSELLSMVEESSQYRAYTDMLKRISKDEIALCIKIGGAHIRLYTQFVTLLTTMIYHELLYKKTIQMSKLFEFYQQFCKDQALSINANSFLTYLTQAYEKYERHGLGTERKPLPSFS